MFFYGRGDSCRHRARIRAGLVHVCSPFIKVIEAFARRHYLRTTAKLFQ
jgi:hypothetical protein